MTKTSTMRRNSLRTLWLWSKLMRFSTFRIIYDLLLQFARGLERTTVSVKNEEPSTTSVPSTTSQARAQTKSDFQPSSQPFTSPQPAQPAPAFKSSPGSRTFSQTVQAGTPPVSFLPLTFTLFILEFFRQTTRIYQSHPATFFCAAAAIP